MYACTIATQGLRPELQYTGPALTGWTSLYQLFFLKRKVGQKKSIRISQPSVVRCFSEIQALRPGFHYAKRKVDRIFQAVRPERCLCWPYGQQKKKISETYFTWIPACWNSGVHNLMWILHLTVNSQRMSLIFSFQLEIPTPK